MSAAVAYAPSIVNRGVHLHPLSLNNAPTKALVGASLKGYSLHCIIFGTATEALAKWSTGTGYLPPRKGIAEDPNGFKKMIEENKNIQVALSTMPNLVKWASFPGANGLQAEQMLIDARDIILSGKETAAQALHETAEKINNLL